jgi:uncharacterized membrane protein YsdA (DUF1294 family)
MGKTALVNLWLSDVTAAQVAAAYLLAVNLAAFALSGLDKRAAKRARRRVPEKHLFRLAVLGGAMGLYLSMFVFHHKTKRGIFRFGVPAIILLQALVFVCVYLQILR